jgi:wyosine [tRNA(Phe)-imidazoG37] synthetase (radical SAM superfamily)
MYQVFAEHNRSLPNHRFVYPVISRRSGGLSLGINLDYNKLCNFDCPYCQVNRREIPSEKFSLLDMQRELLDILQWVQSKAIFELPRFADAPLEFRHFADIAFAGDGEPSVNKDLLPAMQFIQEISRSQHIPNVVLITNSTGLQRPRTRQALEILGQMNGEVWAKLDAGTQAYFEIVSGSSHRLDQIEKRILGIPSQTKLKIQTCLMKIHGVSPSTEEINALKTRICTIHEKHPLKEVQIYTLARIPAMDHVSAIPKNQLLEITAPLVQAGLPVKIYGGSAD